jgi:hypothetical protein
MIKLEVELKNPNDLWALMESLRSFDATVKVANEATAVQPQSLPTEKKPLGDFIGSIPTLDSDAFDQYRQEEGDVAYVPVSSQQTWDFDRFYGAAKTGMTIEEIDTQIQELRQEWERPI